jgi:hypothetical protein
MSAGFIFCGTTYIKEEKHLVSSIRMLLESLTDREILDISYELGYHYYTEWEDENES